MTTTDQRTALVMSTATLEALRVRAAIVPLSTSGGVALRSALARREMYSYGRWRVFCDPAALSFIRDHAPEIARLWPAVFGEVAVPRVATISQAMAMVGQTVAGIESDGRGLRLVFESGDALLIAENGDLDWRAA